MINPSKFLVADWLPGGEMAKEQRYISDKFVGLRGRDLRWLNRRFVSRQGASRDAGIDVIFPIVRYMHSTPICGASMRQPESKPQEISSCFAQVYRYEHAHKIPPKLWLCLLFTPRLQGRLRLVLVIANNMMRLVIRVIVQPLLRLSAFVQIFILQI
jgi:hypothetical protein